MTPPRADGGVLRGTTWPNRGQASEEDEPQHIRALESGARSADVSGTAPALVFVVT
jgi:hypothetical protein